MARILRRLRRLQRRSREERRRLSEGGGTAAQKSASTEGASSGSAQEPQVEVKKLTMEEIQNACQTVFNFDEVYERILLDLAYCQCEIEKILATKSSVDDRLSKLKLTGKPPNSDNLKQIRAVTRQSLELQELIEIENMELSEIRLGKIRAEAMFRSSMSILDQHVANDDEQEGLSLGYLAYIMMME